MNSQNRHGFTESQWEVLKAGPLYMLAHVAGADSLIDRAEWQALIETVGAAASSDSDAPVRDLMIELSAELRAARPISEREDVDGLAGLRAVTLLLDSVPGKGRALRETLLKLGATIADSSGTQVTRTFSDNAASPGWVRSAGTSATERGALRAAAAALGID